MIRRRPAAVYELLAEEELFEPAQSGGSARQSDERAVHDAGSRQASFAAAPVVARPVAAPRRTLLVALTSALLVGFAVWELLGIASESSASRPGAAIQALRPGLAQPDPRARHGDVAHATERARPPRRGRGAGGADRRTGVAARAFGATAGGLATAAPAVEPAPGSSPAAQTPEPGLPTPSPSTSPAEQEFGFER